MDFTFSPEQQELGAVVRSFLAKEWAESEVRRLLDDAVGWDRSTWQRSATELGIQGLAVPERFGGAGYGPIELGVVFEELGRALVGAPYLPSVGLATPAILATGDDAACARYLPGLAAGDTVATLALTEDDGLVGPRRRGHDGRARAGRLAPHRREGQRARRLLRRPAGGGGPQRGGPRCLRGGLGHAGSTLVRTPLPTLDPTRRQARVELRGTPAELVGADGAGEPALQQALRTGAVLLAAEQVGRRGVGARHRRRVRGRPGAVRPPDRLVPGGQAHVRRHAAAAGGRPLGVGLRAAGRGRPSQDLPRAAAIAQSYCSEAATFCVGRCLQIHGGIGFTWEHPTHLYLKRAKSSEALLGSPAWHRAELARLAGF